MNKDIPFAFQTTSPIQGNLQLLIIIQNTITTLLKTWGNSFTTISSETEKKEREREGKEKEIEIH